LYVAVYGVLARAPELAVLKPARRQVDSINRGKPPSIKVEIQPCQKGKESLTYLPPVAGALVLNRYRQQSAVKRLVSSKRNVEHAHKLQYPLSGP
jgi:hypothetical protein